MDAELASFVGEWRFLSEEAVLETDAVAQRTSVVDEMKKENEKNYLLGMNIKEHSEGKG